MKYKNGNKEVYMPEYNGNNHHYRGFGGGGMFMMRIIGVLIFALIFGYAVELLWNWLGPVLFSLKQIGYWEGVGIVIFCRILFGSFMPQVSMTGRDWDDRYRRRILRHMVRRGDNFWNMKGGWSKWKYYNEYWNDEGREAFEKYIEKHEKGPEPGQEDAHDAGTGTGT